MTETTLETELARPLPASGDVAIPADETMAGGPRTILSLTTADLRFFALCYLAGLIFFLVMLS